MPHVYLEQPHRDKKTGKLIDKRRYEYRRRWPAEVKAATGKGWLIYKFEQHITEAMANALEPYISIKFQEVCAAVKANRPVPVLDMRQHQQAIMSGFQPRPYADRSRIQTMPASTPGITEVGDGTYVLDDAPPSAAPAHDPLTVDAVLALYVADNRKNPPGVNNLKVKRSIMRRMLTHFGLPDDLTGVTADHLQAYKEYLGTLGGRIDNDHLWVIKFLFEVAARNRKLPKGNPAADLYVPTKGKPNKRGTFTDPEARTLCLAARESTDPAIRWMIWLGVFTGAINTELGDAMAADIKMMGGYRVLDMRHRELKTTNRPRVIPLRKALTEREGFMDYLAAREGKRLFDGSVDWITDKVNAFIQTTLGNKKSFYFWRHYVGTQLVDLTTGPRADQMIGHAPMTMLARHYVEEELPKVAAVIEALKDPTLLDPMAAAA
jgi:hypothetical protein